MRLDTWWKKLLHIIYHISRGSKIKHSSFNIIISIDVPVDFFFVFSYT